MRIKALQSCIVIAMGSVLMTPSPSRSATVSHSAFPGTEHDIIDIAGFMTTGEDMGPGALMVTAHFSANLMGASETVPWIPGVAGTGAGAALGTFWQLVETGDTWNSLWRLNADPGALPIYALQLEGFPESDETVERGIVFDRTAPSFGTDGSARGRDLVPVAASGNWDHLRVSYSDQVESLAHTPPPASPVGDIYREMTIQFGNLIDVGGMFPLFNPNPFLPGDELTFRQDTDLVGMRVSNGGPGEEGVPEPASVALMAIGFVAALMSRARKREALSPRQFAEKGRFWIYEKVEGGITANESERESVKEL